MKVNNDYCQRVLQRAKVLLATPGRWVQHVFATNEFGNDVPLYSAQARCFCLLGAIRRAEFDLYENTDDIYRSQCVKRIRKRSLNMFGMDSVNFNDQVATTHGDIIRYLDTMIESFDPWYVKLIRAIKKRI